MKRKRKIKPSDKNRSRVGWYIATYVERFEWEGEDRSNLKRRCNAWRNAILVRAKTPEQAYKRAIYWATLTKDTPWRNRKGRAGKLIFEGITSLVPVYDELGDGAELIWWKHDNITVARLRKMVLRKNQLEVLRKQQ